MAKKLPLSIISTFTILSIYGNQSNENEKDKKPSIFIEDDKKSAFILAEKNFTDYSFIVSDEKENYASIINDEVFIDDNTDIKYEKNLSILEYIDKNDLYVKQNILDEKLPLQTISFDDDLYVNKFEPWNQGAEINFSLQEDFFNKKMKNEPKNDDYKINEYLIEDDPYNEGISSSYINYKEISIKDFGKIYLHKGTNGIFLTGNIDKEYLSEKITNTDSLKLYLTNDDRSNEYEIMLDNSILIDNQNETFLNNIQEEYNFNMYIAYEDIGFNGTDDIDFKIISNKE